MYHVKRMVKMIKEIPNGVFPTMLTPFTDGNKIDYNGVEQILNWYSKKKTDGIFAICQSSEIFYLSFEERYELLKFITAHAPKGMSIVASGNTADDIDRQIYEANKFIELGIDAYVFISNRLARQDEDDSVFLKNTERVIKEIPETALGIYECPYPYKRVLSPAVMKELASTGVFRFLKDTCCDSLMIKKKLDAVKGSGFKIFNANAATLLKTLRFGASGYSGVMANFHPEIYSYLCNNFDSNPQKSEEIQNVLGFMSVAECQMYPVNAKYYLTLEGLDITTKCRTRDASEFTESRRLEIDQMHALTQKIKEIYNI